MANLEQLQSQVSQLQKELQTAMQDINALRSRFDSWAPTAGYGIVISGAGDAVSISIGDPTGTITLNCDDNTGTLDLTW